MTRPSSIREGVRAGIVAPLMLDHVNTDAIISSSDISATSKNLGSKLFASWRGTHDGELFVLDQPAYQGAAILLSGANFGCGSSREAAVWALRDFGIQAIIANSFGSIFLSNCVQNQIVPVTLASTVTTELAMLISSSTTPLELSVDVEKQVIELTDGSTMPFTLNPIHQALLATPRSAIDLILDSSESIATFQYQDEPRRPWAYLDQVPTTSNKPPQVNNHHRENPL